MSCVNVVVVPDGHGQLRETVVDDPDQTYKKIHHLDPNTTYSMTIVALTDAGRGPEVTVSAFTVPVSGVSALCSLHNILSLWCNNTIAYDNCMLKS